MHHNNKHVQICSHHPKNTNTNKSPNTSNNNNHNKIFPISLSSVIICLIHKPGGSKRAIKSQTFTARYSTKPPGPHALAGNVCWTIGQPWCAHLYINIYTLDTLEDQSIGDAFLVFC